MIFTNGGTLASKTSYRGRVTLYGNGDFSITRINDGSKGKMYEMLKQTRHAQLGKGVKNLRLLIEVPVAEGGAFMAQCIEDELPEVMNYLKNYRC